MGETRNWFDDQTEALGMAEILHQMREDGWRVACHNDYMQNGELHTFWLFTYGVWCVKGEAKTDYQALRIAFAETKRLTAERGA